MFRSLFPVLISTAIPDRSWLLNPSFKVTSSESSDSHSFPKQAKVEKKKHRQRDRSKHKKHTHSPKRSPPLHTLRPETLWIDEAGLEPRDAYHLDSKPDAHNLHYYSLYRGDVASYRRSFGQHCIGLERTEAVEWTDNRSKAPRERKFKQPRYFSKQSATAATSETLLHLNQRVEEECAGADEAEFLPLEQCRAADDSTQVSSELTPEAYLSQCTARYNRSLLEQPHNISLWLEFIAFQDQAVLWGRPPAELPETAMEGRRKSYLAVVERKLAIVDRALESNPLSVELLLRQMALAGEVWEDDRLMRRWKDLVFQQPNKLQLWLSYIEFCQSRFSSFALPSLISLYTKCLSTVSAIQEGTLKSHKPGADTPFFLLAVFTLYCNCLKQAGQTEKAVACFQALIEFNLCCPPELDSQDLPTKARLEFFEAFWDSSVPRFGEEGARGWSSWVNVSQYSSSAGEGPPLGLLETTLYLGQDDSSGPSIEVDSADPELSLIAGLPLQEAWLRLERQRGRKNSLPWRPEPQKGETEEDCTDPDQLVLFDDISQSLFHVRDPELQLQVVLTFLHFLGAPLPTSPLLLPTPHHISLCLESPCEIFLPSSSTLRNLLSTEHISPLFPHQLTGVGCDQELLASGVLEDILSERTITPSQCSEQTTTSGFISRVYNQALSLLSDPAAQTTLAQLWLQRELSRLDKPGKMQKQRTKAVQRLVKALLRAEPHRNNLLLWNCCALQEHLLGNPSEAIKLYETVLSQYQLQLASVGQSPLPVLFRCFTECLLGLQPLCSLSVPTPNVPLALHCLAAMAEGKYTPLPPEKLQMSPARVLKIHTLFQQMSGSSSPSPSPHQVACHAYFEYLTRGLRSAVAVFDGYLAVLSNKLAPEPSGARTSLHNLELTYYLQARLIVHHSQNHPTQPAVLRAVLEAALSLFPDHNWFLAAYIECEHPSFVSGRLRRYFDTHAPKAKTAIPWVFAIAAELQRHRRLRELAEGSEEVGGLHRVRALLRRATQCPNGRICPLLWRLFMKFEVTSSVIVLSGNFYTMLSPC